MRRSRSLLVAAAVAAALVAPLTAQYRMEPGEGSLRLVVSCNVDGTYTCANERCGQYCCNMPG